MYCPVEAAIYASLEKQQNSLMAQQYAAQNNNDTELMAQLTQKRETLTKQMDAESIKCQIKPAVIEKFKATATSTVVVPSTTATTSTPAPTPATTPTSTPSLATTSTTTEVSTEQIAVASVCYVSYESEKELKDAWNEYYTLVQSNETTDTNKISEVKARISKAEDTINGVRSKCQSTTAQAPTVAPASTNATAVATATAASAPGQVIKPGENCTVPVELTQEFEGLWKTYNAALAANQTENAGEIKIKITAIEEKISAAKGQCVKTIVTEKAGARDVAAYYTEKVTQIMTEEKDIDAQIDQLKQLRTEIDDMIANLIKKKNQLNASEVAGIIDEIKISPRQIQAGTSVIETTNTTILTQIGNKQIEIKPSETGVTMKEENITIDAPNISIKDNKIEIADKEVTIAPSSVLEKTRITKTKELNLSTENNTPVYNVKGDENRKLLWLIPITMEKKVKIDASTENVITEEKPWWSALTTPSG